MLGNLMTEDGQFNFEPFLAEDDCAGVDGFSVAETGASDSAYFSTTSGVGTESVSMSLGSVGGMSASGW